MIMLNKEFSLSLSLYVYYVVLFHVINKDNNNLLMLILF